MSEQHLAALSRPSKALAWSEASVDAGDFSGPCVAVWLPEGCTAALGISQKPELELDVSAVRRDGVGVVRRQSGGGAVLLYPGVVCWEAWAATDEIERIVEGGSGIRQSYAALSLPVVEALKGLGLDVFHAGICDISTMREGWAAPKKLAGTAQLRRRDRVLVHGSLLVAPEMGLLERYLGFPSQQPDYRQDRSHRDFCVSVADLLGFNDAKAAVGEVSGAILECAGRMGWRVLAVPERLGEAAEKLEQNKYRSDAWNWEKVRPV